MTTFGIDITTDDLIDTLGFFDSWEERYKYIIDLGKELPEQDDSFKLPERLIKGCQSQVWIDCERQGDELFFKVDSDAHIVKGLLAVVLTAFNAKTADQILAFDVDQYFKELDLIKHLTPTRGNGLRSMVARIRDFASQTA